MNSAKTSLNEAVRLSALAQHHEDIGEYVEAERLFSRSVELRERELGSDNNELADDLYNLGLLNLALDNNVRAEKLLIRSLLIRRLKFDCDHPDVIDTIHALNLVWKEQEGLARAHQ